MGSERRTRLLAMLSAPLGLAVVAAWAETSRPCSCMTSIRHRATAINLQAVAIILKGRKGINRLGSSTKTHVKLSSLLFSKLEKAASNVGR